MPTHQHPLRSESVLSTVFGAPVPTDLTGFENFLSAFETDVEAFAATVDPSASDFTNALATAVPTAVYESIAASGIAPFTPTAPPSWFATLAPSLQSEIVSAESQVRSLYTQALSVTDAGPGVYTQGALATGSASAAASSGSASGSGSTAASSSSSSSSSAAAPKMVTEAVVGVLAAMGVAVLALM